VIEDKKQKIEKSKNDSASTINGLIDTRDNTPKMILIKPKTTNTFTTFFIINPL